MRHLGTRRSWLFLQSYPGHADSPHSCFFFYVESCMCLTIGTVVREASPGLWLSASLQTNRRNMTHFSMHPSWGVQVFIQPLLLGKSWAVIIPVMLPLLACSQPSLALWLSPLCEKCLQWGKALNPFIPQFLHLWICLARWMEENSLF